MIIVPMDKPKTCSKCMFCYHLEGACLFIELTTWTKWLCSKGKGRHPECPLKQHKESAPTSDKVLEPKQMFFWRNPDETENLALSRYGGPFRICGSATAEIAEKDAINHDADEGFTVFQASSTQFNNAHR